MKSNKEIAAGITNDPKLAAEIEKALNEAEVRSLVLQKMFDEKTAPEACGPKCVVAEHYKHMSPKEANAVECHCLDGLSEFNTKKLKHALKWYRRELASARQTADSYAWSDNRDRGY